MHATIPITIRQRLCASCLRSWRGPNCARFIVRAGLQNSDQTQRRHKGYIAPAGEQAHPITGYYAEMLKKPSAQVQPLTRTEPESLPPIPSSEVGAEVEEKATDGKEDLFSKARIIFGSTDALAERKQEIERASQNVAGIMVPPKPEEPDNCCMSGCVNCVWDMFRDEMEEWATKSAQARMIIQAQRREKRVGENRAEGRSASNDVAVSMDDDGGGSETNWSTEVEADKLFDDIPVGIREFMRTEKKLKQMQKEHAASANVS